MNRLLQVLVLNNTVTKITYLLIVIKIFHKLMDTFGNIIEKKGHRNKLVQGHMRLHNIRCVQKITGIFDF